MGDPKNFVEKKLKELLKLLEIKAEINSKYEDNKVSIDLIGENLGMLIGFKGETLRSLESLISLFAYKKFKEKIYVSLDVGNFKKRKEEKLVQLAESVAYEARFKSTPISLAPMNSYERKIVHEAVSKIAGVKSESVGEDFSRYVVISPS